MISARKNIQTGTTHTIKWSDFLARFKWYQGDHLSIIGPTNSGKTTLLLSLLYKREYTVVFGTKPKDDTLEALITRDKRKRRFTSVPYERIPVWPPNDLSKKVVLWPKVKHIGDTKTRASVFAKALASIYKSGGWCICADEVWYLSNRLGLSEELEEIWSQGRSIGITLASATQRPRNVPLMMYSQATHLFLFKTGDDYDRNRLGGMGAADTKQVISILEQLPHRTFLYVNAATGELLVSKVELQETRQ